MRWSARYRAARSRWISRRHSSFPVLASLQMVSSRSPSLAVRNSRPPTMMGDDWPKGTDVFQTTFFDGENSTGYPVPESTPDPLGPRKPVHCAFACVAAISHRSDNRCSGCISLLLDYQMNLRTILVTLPSDAKVERPFEAAMPAFVP